MTQATKKKKRVSAVIQILLEISYSVLRTPKTESETRKLKSHLETNIKIYELDSAESKPDLLFNVWYIKITPNQSWRRIINGTAFLAQLLNATQ